MVSVVGLDGSKIAKQSGEVIAFLSWSTASVCLSSHMNSMFLRVRSCKCLAI